MERLKMAIVKIKKVYDKTSHFRKGNYAPVISIGYIDEKKQSIDVTVHMTPELRKHPTERAVLLRHETREAKLLAEGKSVHYAHRQAASKDPQYLKGEQGLYNIWDRLGHKKPKFQ
jgi:hypothetical protein